MCVSIRSPTRCASTTVTANNYRINPATGVATTDTQIAYAPGDAGAGIAPRVAGIAYSNNAAGATSTTLYVIDTNRGVLAVQGSPGGTPLSPSSGQLTTVGALGVPTNDVVGLDINRSGTVLASLTAPGTGVTSLYSVNLTTGAATLIGPIGLAGHSYLGLAFAPVPIASYGITPNQIAVGTTLDSFVGVPGTGLNSALSSLDSLSPADRAAALSQLTPAAYSLLPELTLQTAEFEQMTIQRYLRDFRDGATGGTVTGDGKIGSFLVARGRYGDFRYNVDRPEVDYSSAGIMGGIDYRYSDRVLIGLTGGYDRADVRLGTNVPNSAIKNYFGGGYATLRFGPAYVDGYGSYGEADYSLLRAARFGASSFDFAANTHSRTWLAGGTVGIKLAVAGFVAEPFAGVRYADVRIRGFTDGTDFGGLTVPQTEYRSVLGNFGAKLGAEFAVGSAVVRPEIRGAFRREFRSDGSNGFGYSFAGTGATTTLLPFTPTPLARSYATAGAGFTVSGPHSPLALVIDYDGEFARDRHINGITGGLRLAF